jgi:hypothetical protein
LFANAKFTPQNPCFSKPFYGNIPWQGYDEDRAYKGMFDLDIYYRNGINCLNGEQPLKKPVILIDGFDPTDKRNTKNNGLYARFLKYIDDVNYPISDKKEVDFVEQVQRLGNDVILVDIPTYWVPNTGNIIHLDSNANTPPPGYTLDMGKLIRGGGDYVERNGRTMVDLLIWVQAKMAAAGSTASIVLVGPSMGGQITRYALKYMEDRGIPHRVKLWISQDSNHEGATVPIGEQLVIATLANTDEKTAKSRDRQLMCPANKQFIVDHFLHHIDNLTNLNIVQQNAGGAPSFFNRYYNSIDSIGWPQLCRKVSIVSGGENGDALNVPAASELAMRIKGTVIAHSVLSTIPIIFNLISNNTNKFDVFDIKMFTAPKPNVLGEVASVAIKGDSAINKRFYSKGIALTRNQSIETVQSGFYRGYEELGTFIPRTKLQWSNQFPAGFALIKFDKEIISGIHAFQPTGSTLAYGKGTNPNIYFGSHFKWDDNVTNYNLSCDKYIPFDAYMGPKDFSVLHDSIFYPQAQVIINEIQGIKYERAKPLIYLQVEKANPNITTWCAGTILYFNAYSTWYNGAITPNWYVNNSICTIVSGQGTNTIGVLYHGGATYDVTGQSNINIGILGGENQCYTFSGSSLNMNAGDYWVGGFSSVTPGVINERQLNFISTGTNNSEAARINLIAGLAYRPNTATQQYSLESNRFGTPITWNVTPVTLRGKNHNMLNITSGAGGSYQFKVTDINSCYTSNTNNWFSLNFGSGRGFVFRVAPNPVSYEINVEKILTNDKTTEEKNKPKLIKFAISNLTTRQKLYSTTKLNVGNVFKIPVSQLRNGEYILEITYGDEFIAEKIIVRK